MYLLTNLTIITDLIMKNYFYLVLFITISSSLSVPKGGVLENGGKIWALLVAGSNGYYNYRHQVSNIIINLFLFRKKKLNKIYSFFRLIYAMHIKFYIKMEFLMNKL